jgi:hypothetical protein
MEHNIKRVDNWSINKSAGECPDTWTYVEIVDLQWDLNKNEHPQDLAIGW